MIKRPLVVDFDLYADNDPDFKQELIELMVDNLEELLEAYKTSVEQKDPPFFSKACHKVKTTLVMLEDKELDALVEDLKTMEADETRAFLLKKICEEIIASLWLEKK
jgi:hypothetical protein